ncbi:MAG TPA: pilus assembly protein TadG-related protein, partial [Bdellovibrionales bacterium]|nr:pilus assembly protein TadG-related protein [Bdellovibrionales bacterium]
MIRSERGQAAIFVALLFNVLFVFFAMAINVALVVHDKINLQNSTDLAAYYAAAKQAEVLNAIAHQNYAIRQSYKLLAWRYRVLGTMG